MNNIAIALTKAGVQVPTQKQRIWQWLSDNGPHDMAAVASELNIPEPSCQAAITDLRNRQMLSTIPRDNGKGKRLTNHYGALGRKWELLNLPKKGAAGDRARAAAAANREAAKVVYEPKAEVIHIPEFRPEVFLGKLTLSELRSVHAYLGRFFK